MTTSEAQSGADGNEDTRGQLQEQIAEALAELSEATDAPAGFETCAQFSPSDVEFTSDSWMSRLADVQGWMHFPFDLPTDSPANYLAKLLVALGIDESYEGNNKKLEPTTLPDSALERLSERAETAVRQQQAFFAKLDSEGGSNAAATTEWQETWIEEEDNSEEVSPEPVAASAEVWAISVLAGADLNLTPSYQRGDVWKIGDRQALIESILRGIPLPSIILLNTGAATPYEVVDGKQRLTAILRFIGKHPVAMMKIREADETYPEANFPTLFETDYLKFKKAWTNVTGESLNARLEDQYYFPFKLRNDGRGGLNGPMLEPLRGKFYTEIKENVVNVADQEVKVKNLFGAVPRYKIPVIEYTKASQRQIHEVFKLYNKQGKHLNAEEIRNAIYHDVELTRAILAAAGDASRQINIEDIAPSLGPVKDVRELGQTLKEYGFGDSRYRRTKILGWILATLLNDSQGKDMLSTAKHIDLLLDRVQKDTMHPLRKKAVLSELFSLISQAVDLHAAHDELWSDKFKDGGKGAKWQELQLVGSLVGMILSVSVAPDSIESRLDEKASEIYAATSSAAWTRPEKTQTRTQWDYIARIVTGLTTILDVDVQEASAAIREKFGSSGVDTLLAALINKSAE